VKEPAILLLAHGARDARWAEPFARVAALVRGAEPDRPAEIAYLEFLEPDLPTAARRLAAHGSKRIRIVPLFFGRGGHLREGVPRLVAEMAARMPGVAIEVADAAGEDAVVIQAIAEYCLRAARGA
jgi:sirohydrochlorin cobaltochelatase